MLRIGDRIRPRGAINYGTLGFFCIDNQGRDYLATCDHVVKTISTPDQGPWKLYYPRNHSYQSGVALFSGKSLASADNKIADFAVAEILVSIDEGLHLPEPLPGTLMQNIVSVSPVNYGQEILLWGAKTKIYIPGVVMHREPSDNHAWPHPKYGLVEYKLQFSVALLTAYIPEVGDSGGYVITKNGEIVGLISALSGEVTESGASIIHCAPVQQALDELGLQLKIT